MLKKSDFESPGATVDMKGVSKDSTTLALLKATIFKCPVCEGKGHEFWECPTKRTLDSWAKAHNDQQHWGQWKYERYYSAFGDSQKERFRELGKKNATGWSGATGAFKRRKYA